MKPSGQLAREWMKRITGVSRDESLPDYAIPCNVTIQDELAALLDARWNEAAAAQREACALDVLDTGTGDDEEFQETIEGFAYNIRALELVKPPTSGAEGA